MIEGAKIESRENFEVALERNRRSQHQRSSDTIERLSKATISLMTEVGFVNMTTTSIAARAGVSRGALLHHFPNKVALVTYATGEMWRGVVASTDELSTLSDPANIDPEGFVEALWEGAMAQTHVSVSVDLVLAANGNPVLRAHVDKWVARMFDSYRAAGRHAFGQSDLSRAECDALIATVASTLRGQRISQMLAPDPACAKAVCAMLAKLLRDQLQKVAK